MNKFFTLFIFIIHLFFVSHSIYANCHIDDWKGLKALYESTDGDSWTNRAGWDVLIDNKNNPPANCNLSNLHGVSVELGRVWQVDLSGNGLIGTLPEELGNITHLIILKLNDNHLCGVIPAALGNLNFLLQIILNNNSLSGCYSFNLSQLCDQLQLFSIFGGDNVVASWGDFCDTNISACFPGETYTISVATDYSGIVDITTTFNQAQEFILDNGSVKLMHYPNCYDGDYDNCDIVNHFDNKTANEVLWATEKASLFFNNFGNFNLPQLKSYTHCSYDNRFNEAVLNSEANTIYYGKGDSLERYSMTAPDIIGRTYTHYLAQQSDGQVTSLSNYSESGALKESFADIFGEMIENACNGQNDWVVGSQVIASPVSASGIRSFNNPSDNNMQYQLPDTYKGNNWVNINIANNEGENDNIAQLNNGVHNHWFYLLTEGGSGVNDDGTAYSVTGIGKALATELAFANFESLKPNATYYDAVFNSVNLAKSDFAGNPQIAIQAQNAWEAVGLDLEKVSNNNNPITWKLDNYQVNGETSFINNEGITMMPRHVDLIIDSLGQDISADELTITMQIPHNYRDVQINHIYQPLTADQLNIIQNNNEITVTINRQNAGAAKTSMIPPIPSGSPIFRVGICIVVIDLGVISSDNTLSIFKYGQNTIDGAKPEYFFIVENTNANNSLTLSNKLINQDCLALGAIETTVINSVGASAPPYNYYLHDASGNILARALSKNESSHQFNNLKEGEYELRVEDNSNKNMEFNFNVAFEAKRNGSNCCPEKLFIPSGDIEGTFNATDRIEINSNTTINSGKIYICN